MKGEEFVVRRMLRDLNTCHESVASDLCAISIQSMIRDKVASIGNAFKCSSSP